MGLIQAAVGSIGGTLADQWKDFYTVPDGLPATAALFAAVPRGTNAGRGSNTRGSTNIISNGSKIVVPEGYGLLLFQDGRLTGFGAEAGAYEWRSDDVNSKSIFARGTWVMVRYQRTRRSWSSSSESGGSTRTASLFCQLFTR